MDHRDHVDLLRSGVEGAGMLWADMGAGAGAFTLALADILGPGGEVWAIDRDGAALRRNARAMAAQFPQTRVCHVEADFRERLELPPLDGIVMANSLHFQREQAAVVRTLRGYLRAGAHMVVIEYNTAHANFAVPHPVPFEVWERLARDAGFEHTEVRARRPGSNFGGMYSAVSW